MTWSKVLSGRHGIISGFRPMMFLETFIFISALFSNLFLDKAKATTHLHILKSIIGKGIN
jgi:hypothetical protein